MGHANQSRHLAFAILPLLFAITVLAQTQTSAHGLDSYVRVIAGQGGTGNQTYIENLYKAPLVAYTFEATCNGGWAHRTEGYADAALQRAWPLPSGEERYLNSPREGCETSSITAAMFADGKDVGEPAQIQKILARRRYAKDELHRAFEGEIITNHPADWDPELSIVKLKQRISTLASVVSENQDEQSVRRGTINTLIERLQAFAEAKKDSDPQKEHDRRIAFWAAIQDWEEKLDPLTYPSRGVSWN